jgi:alpha-beta hydrolase superfamily lysophospholipase
VPFIDEKDNECYLPCLTQFAAASLSAPAAPLHPVETTSPVVLVLTLARLEVAGRAGIALSTSLQNIETVVRSADNAESEADNDDEELALQFVVWWLKEQGVKRWYKKSLANRLFSHPTASS